jgi:uncharacterized membrane protein (UPF0127 family)
MQRRIMRTIQIVIGAGATSALLVLGFTASQSNGSNPPATAPAQQPPPTTMPEPVYEQVTIGGEQFKLELAIDEPSRAKGLMGRTSISPSGGMIFVHPYPQVQAYWMAYCVTDMDIMYLDTRGRIVSTHTMKVEPPKRDEETTAQYELRLRNYTSGRPAMFAIELKAGTIERLKLKPGMDISLDLERLKKMAK